ncbi:winged helix-turn-helix domain-containing protein [Pseudocitrobacter faecalis]|nr:winged helix-turn-helix domain-containing protein [Pseudocitrobacter faecalis]
MSIIVNNWRMDPSQNALIHCVTGEMRRLGEYHFLLLETLTKNADEVLSRTYLCGEVWKNRIVGGNSLPTAIHALRAAIDDDGRQQNIIKTVPKKGYLCNKEYVDLVDDVAPDVTEPTQPVLTEMQEEIIHVDIPVKPVKRAFFTGKKIISLVLLAAIALSVGLFFARHRTIGTPLLIQESINSPRIKIYHLRVSGKNDAPLSEVLAPSQQKLETLLSAHDMTMTMYYRNVHNRLESDMVLRNQCNGSWQLTFNVEDWQNSDINRAMYLNLEQLLNSVQKC